MQIIIDTNKDSPLEIRKAIRLLQSFIGQTPSDAIPSNSVDSGEPQSTPGFMNIFGNNDEQSNEPVSESSNDKSASDDDDVKFETY